MPPHNGSGMSRGHVAQWRIYTCFFLTAAFDVSFYGAAIAAAFCCRRAAPGSYSSQERQRRSEAANASKTPRHKTPPERSKFGGIYSLASDEHTRLQEHAAVQEILALGQSHLLKHGKAGRVSSARANAREMHIQPSFFVCQGTGGQGGEQKGVVNMTRWT